MIVCPVCAKENEDFFRFCLGCGADLEEAAPEEATVAVAVAAPEPSKAKALAPEPVEAPEPEPVEAPEPEPVEAPEPEPAVAAAPTVRGPRDVSTVETEAVGPDEATAAGPPAVEIPDLEELPGAAERTSPDMAPVDLAETPLIRPPTDPRQPRAGEGPVPHGANGRPPAAPRPGGPPPRAAADPAGGAVRRDTHAEVTSVGKRGGPGATLVRRGSEPVSGPSALAELPPGSGPPTIDETHCRVCHAELQAGFAFCANCGAPIAELIPVTDRQELTPEPPRSGVTRGRITLIREDGTDGDSWDLDEAGTVIGRDGAHVSFPEDDFLAPRHVELVYEAGELHIRPYPTTNGVFIRILEETPLEPGDSFRVGQELLRLDLLRDLIGTTEDHDGEGTLRLGSPLPRDVWGRLSQQIGPDSIGDAFLLIGDDVYLGRERGDITFPDDGYVSGSHALVARRGRQIFLKDLGSSNGTYLRLTGNRTLRKGDYVLAGQQLFRVEP